MRKLLFLSVIFIYSVKALAQTTLTKDYIDSYSLTTSYVIMSKNTKDIGNATGFFIRVKGKLYFITNNHVVGAEFYKDEYLRKNKRVAPSSTIPDTLKVRLYGAEIMTAGFFPFSVKDNLGNDNFIRFYENEADKSTLLDVVAFKADHVNLPIPGASLYLDSLSLEPNLNLYPASELFVVGFPLNIGRESLYPIWKRGTVASDPNLQKVGVSKFLIDATTRSGMSGSPVFFRGESYSTGTSNYIASGLKTFLIGIYQAQDTTSEIGLVTRLDKVFQKLSQ